MNISVIITCHNYARFLSRAIRSALSQSLDNRRYEIVVVDDASTDETKDVMGYFAGLIRPIFLSENVGLAEARNEGIRSALGQMIINLDADDYFDENILLIESLYLFSNQEIDAVSCDYFIIDEKERHIKRVSGEQSPLACGIMMRKDLLFEIGLYDREFKAREEEDLRTRFLKNNYNVHNIRIPLYRYRKHKNNLTNNTKIMDQFNNKLKEKHGSSTA